MKKLYKLLVLCLFAIAGGSALKAQTMNVTDGTNTYYADDAISLNEAVTHILEDGSRTFTVNLPSDAETELFTAIRRAIIDTEGVEDGSINLTLAGVEAIPNHDEFDPSNLIFGEYLGDEGIEYVDQLASVNLPDVISIGERAFCGCENLVSITAPKAQIVSDWAFASTGISELELPEVTSIGWAAFIVCENLSTVILPKATNIGQQAFDIKSLTLTSLMLLSEDDIYIEKKALGYPESFSANIDLVLNANKKDEVTNGLNWNGFAFKSIMYPCVDGSMNHTYEDVVNNGNETHSFTCTTCGKTKVESCHGGEATCMEHASCDVCGEKYGEFSEHIIDHTTGYCKFGCGEFLAGAKVTSGKTVTYYKTLDELHGNPQNGATITLLREINPEVENYRYEYIEEHNKIITVDLNGYNFNRDGYEIYVSGSEGMLTLVNTAEHRAGVVSAYLEANANKFTVDRNVDIDAILIASNAVDAIIDLSNADFVSSTIKVSGDGFDVSQIILKNHVICDADGNEVTGELAKNVTYNLLAYGIMATVNPMNAGAVTGAGTYNDGEEATLVATPNEGYKFLNWTENDTIVSEESEYTFIVDGNRNFVANFELLTFEVTVSVNEENFGTVTGAGTYNDGEEVTLTATPNEGYKFVNWIENDTVVSEEAEFTFVVKGDRNFVANFELLTYEVTASVNEENFGTVAGAGVYDYGEEVTLTAIPNEGYKFVNWTENDTVVSGEAEYTFVVKGDRNFVANFELLTCEVTASVNEENFGVVTGSGTYNHGEEVTLTATPNEGYKFVNWTENDTIVSEEAEYTFVVDGNRNLVANFVTLHEITASVNDENFGAVAGAGVYGYGEEVTLTATPNEGYKFVNWTENDTVVSGEAEYTFVVKGDRNFVANFELLTYEVTASVNEENFGTVAGAGVYGYGEEVTLTATANEGYKFVNWTENDTVVSGEAEYTFVVKGDRNFVANFELLTYEVTASVNEENFGTVAGAGVYDYGEEVTLTAIPNEGYKFVNWTENDTVVSEEAEYTFVVKGNRNLVANFVSTESIDELTASFRLYPNPANDKLNIVTETEIEEVVVYDAFGRQQLAVSCQQSAISVSGLNAGVYFVMIKTSEGVVTKRFVKK